LSEVKDEFGTLALITNSKKIRRKYVKYTSNARR